jgi:hypothetical protein
MAYILDFQDTNFPYQAVIKTAAGSMYIGQIPLSASLVGFSSGQSGSSAQVTVLPMGGFGSTAIKFSEYDWAKCVPTPSDFTTNAGIMSYLSTYFTGQAIVPTPTPLMSKQLLMTSPFNVKSLAGNTKYFPIAAGRDYPYDNPIEVLAISSATTLVDVFAIVPQFTLDDSLRISLVQDGNNLAEVIITGTGYYTFTLNIANLSGSEMYYVINNNANNGDAYISSMRIICELP